ncbi:MAG TPA: SusD/RagB family nutrient-binding outer membrane lipoprotein [Mucilaginibacter sp.]|jgi:hypothetical protein|nr:SusD/RagB family nutrient-binding outer membrane lipoprotein [Mucilaginibacter sp.]
MKKLNKFIIGLVALSLLAPSCKKDFIGVNTNPTALNTTSPEYLFSGVTVDINEKSRAQLIARYNFMAYMQYIVTDNNASLASKYCGPGTQTGPDMGVDYYSDYYSGVGITMKRVIALIDQLPEPQKSQYTALRAIAVIVDTYHAWRIADLYGAMPYSQAFQPDAYPNPAYDYNFTLYKTFDNQLKQAATVLNSNPTGQIDISKQDFFYAGSIPNWLAFANTLRIKIAQRYEKRDATNLTAVLNDIQTNFAGNIISSNAQSFGVNHSQGYDTNLDDINAIQTTYDAGYAFVEFLKSTNDPRLALMVRQNDMGTNSARYNTVAAGGDAQAQAFLAQPQNQVRYYGKHAFPASQDPSYGLTGNTRYVNFNVGTSSVPLDYISLIQGRYFVKNSGFKTSTDPLFHTDEPYLDVNTIKMRTLWLSYGETCFTMAEIAQKNGGSALGKSADQWYNAGVQASFDQYKAVGAAIGVPNASAVTIGDYLTRFPYNGTLDRIYSQEWVHLLAEPEESYAMWKRTGYPKFVDYRAGQPTTPGNIGDGTGTAYLENLWDGTQNLLIPRRMSFTVSSAGSVLNSDNLFKAISGMQAKDAAYGASGTDTKGRIWWDQ